MKAFLAALCLSVSGLLSPAAAEEVIASYYTTLGPADFYSSNGVRLQDLGAVIQQDRANLYRLGRGDPGDEADPFFSNKALRSQIPQLVARGPARPNISNIVRNGTPIEVVVFVCGYRSQPFFISVDYANGDGYRAC